MHKRSYYTAWGSYAILFVLSVNFCGNQAVLELEPAGAFYVCSGGTLRVKCNSTAYLLEWQIRRSDQLQGTITRSFQVDGSRMTTTPISVNSTTLNVSRSLPLNSTISTDNTTADFNGTVITCSEQAINATTLSSASVQIILVGNNVGNVNIAPHINISQWFEINHITVALEWTTINGASYSVNVVPELAINYTGRRSAQLSLSYNIKYNISITASLCGKNNTIFSVLNHLTCPQAQSSSDDSVRISSYRNPATEGTTITFSCPDGLILIGSNTSTCMENGEWEPKLIGTNCKADCHTPVVNSNVSVNYSSTLEDSLLTFQCEDGLLPDRVFISRCYGNESWIPNPSSHVCATFLAVNCGNPLPPLVGYLEPYTSTSEGARVNRVHVCQNGQLATEEIVCGSEGDWESVNNIACLGSKPTVDLLAIISGSLGSLLAVALLVCGILFVVIVVISRNIGKAVSNSGEQKHGQSKHQNPEYEEDMATRNEAACDKPKDLEMMQNVAYGPLQF